MVDYYNTIYSTSIDTHLPEFPLVIVPPEDV
jgi:hypothetical protein